MQTLGSKHGNKIIAKQQIVPTRVKNKNKRFKRGHTVCLPEMSNHGITGRRDPDNKGQLLQ